MTRPTIYVAGPYSKGIPDQTFAAAADAADALANHGWLPIVPQFLTFIWAVRHFHPADYWYAFAEDLLRKCDAVVRLPGESRGADQEVELARKLGLPIYATVEAAVLASPQVQARLAKRRR